MAKYTLQEVQRMYDSKKEGTFEAAAEVFEESPNKDSALLVVASFCTIIGFSDEENDNLIGLANIALLQFDSVKDIREADQEWQNAIIYRADTLVRMYVDSLLAVRDNNSKVPAWQKVIPINADAAMTKVLLHNAIIRSDHYKQLLEKEGISEEEAKEKYPITSNKSSYEKIIYNGALKIKDRIEQVLRSGIGGDNKDILIAQMTQVTSDYWLSDLMLDCAKEDDDIKKDCMINRYELGCLALNAVAHPYGGTCSIINLQNQRNQITDSANSIARQINSLYPEISLNVLPYTDAVNVKAQGGCYVATAVYGSYDCPEVWVLRRYRDNSLALTWYGRAFVRTYYAISPTLVKLFGNNPWVIRVWRGRLDVFVKRLQTKGYESTPYEDKVW